MDIFEPLDLELNVVQQALLFFMNPVNGIALVLITTGIIIAGAFVIHIVTRTRRNA